MRINYSADDANLMEAAGDADKTARRATRRGGKRPTNNDEEGDKSNGSVRRGRIRRPDIVSRKRSQSLETQDRWSSNKDNLLPGGDGDDNSSGSSRGRSPKAVSIQRPAIVSRVRSQSLDTHDRKPSKNKNKTKLLPGRPSIFAHKRSLMRSGSPIPNNLMVSTNTPGGRAALFLSNQKTCVLSQVVGEEAQRKEYEKRKSTAHVGLKDMFSLESRRDMFRSLDDFDEMGKDEEERDAAAKCIQRFFKHSMFVLAQHHDEIKYWKMEIHDVKKRCTTELKEIKRIKELEKQRIEVDLHIEFGREYDKTGLEWGTYHAWTKQQMTQIEKERDEAKSLKESIRLLKYDNVHAKREINLLEDKERHLKAEVKRMEQKNEKWLRVVRRLENAITKVQDELSLEQEKIHKQEHQIKSLKAGIDKAIGVAWTMGPTATPTPAAVAVSPESKQVGVTAEAAKGCDKETAARRIQRFFRRAMVALDYCYDEIAYWEAERDCCKRRQQEEMLAIQDQLEMEKKEALVQLNHELELEGDTKEEEQQDAHLDFDAFSDKIFKLKRKIRKAKKEKQELEEDVQTLIKENRQLDQANAEQTHKNRTLQEKVNLLEVKRDETKDIGLGCEAAIDVLSKEIIDTVNQRMDRNERVENKAAFCIQRFFRQVVAVVNSRKKEIAYWENEKREVERRRLGELEEVKRLIEVEKQRLQLEFLSEANHGASGEENDDQKHDLSEFCGEIESLNKKVRKEKKRREKLLGDIRFLQYKNKQIEQAMKVQCEMTQNLQKEVEKSESNKSMLEAGIEKCEQGEERLEAKLAKAKKKKKVERARKKIHGNCIVDVVDLVEARGSATRKGAKLLKTIRKIQSNVMEVPKEEEETKADEFKKLASEGTLEKEETKANALKKLASDGTLITCDMSDSSSSNISGSGDDGEEDGEGDKATDLQNDTALWRVIVDRRTNELPPPTTNKACDGKKRPPRRVLSNKDGRTGACLWREVMEGQKKTRRYTKQFERVMAEATGKNNKDDSAGGAPRRGRRGETRKLRRNVSRSVSPEKSPMRKPGRVLRGRSTSLPESEMKQLLKNACFEEPQDKSLSNEGSRTGSCLWGEIMEGQKKTRRYTMQFERIKAEATGENNKDVSTGEAPRRGRRGGTRKVRRNVSRSASPEKSPMRKPGRVLRGKSTSLPESEMKQLLKNVCFEEPQDKSLSNEGSRTGSCLWGEIMEGQKKTRRYTKQFERIKAEATGW